MWEIIKDWCFYALLIIVMFHYFGLKSFTHDGINIVWVCAMIAIIGYFIQGLIAGTVEAENMSWWCMVKRRISLGIFVLNVIVLGVYKCINPEMSIELSIYPIMFVAVLVYLSSIDKVNEMINDKNLIIGG